MDHPLRSAPVARVLAVALTMVVSGACAGDAAPSGQASVPPTQASTLPPPLDPVDAVSTYLDDPTPTALADAVAAVDGMGPGDPRLAEILDTAAIRFDAAPGRTTIAAPIGFNQYRQVTIRTPDGYDPREAWPLIVAYHSWGGTADRMLDRMEDLLGGDIERFVVAAPDDYRQTVLDAPPPVSAEHISIWREVATHRHIDSDRIHLAGYSLGGETVMTTATLHGHRIAGGLAWAATPALPPDVEGMYEWFAPNLRDLPLLHVWGADDDLNIPGLNGRRSPRRLNELDRTFGPIAVGAGLDRYVPIEVTGADHSTTRPPLDATLALLDWVRGPVPTDIEHVFRYVHQADTAWVEGHEWAGAAWLQTWPSPEIEAGLLDPTSEAAVIRDLLGTISASAADNEIAVTTSHLSDLTVWLTDGLVDFDEPITLSWNGSTVFSGTVEPDTGIAISQAERTRDFSRLRWAGVRITEGIAHLVTTDDVFPTVARGVVIG